MTRPMRHLRRLIYRLGLRPRVKSIWYSDAEAWAAQHREKRTTT